MSEARTRFVEAMRILPGYQNAKRAAVIAYADATCKHGVTERDWQLLYEQGIHNHEAACRAALLRACGLEPDPAHEERR